jgi:hypothetical protein
MTNVRRRRTIRNPELRLTRIYFARYSISAGTDQAVRLRKISFRSTSRKARPTALLNSARVKKPSWMRISTSAIFWPAGSRKPVKAYSRRRDLSILIFMRVHVTQTAVDPLGRVVLEHLPFQPGEKVEVTVRSQDDPWICGGSRVSWEKGERGCRRISCVRKPGLQKLQIIFG